VPTYEYACKGECGDHLEVYQSFDDPALTECPTCGGALRKVFGNIGISFKGSGFYKTDSRSSKGESSTSGDGAPSKESSSKESSSKETSSKESSSKESKDGSKDSKPAKDPKPSKSSDSGSKSSSSAASAAS
jgi:putative FmdB family regulatory protein